jgi:hypothetical protein
MGTHPHGGRTCSRVVVSGVPAAEVLVTTTTIELAPVAPARSLTDTETMYDPATTGPKSSWGLLSCTRVPSSVHRYSETETFPWTDATIETRSPG